VAEDGVVRASADENAIAGVEGDDVALARRRSPNDIGARVRGELDAVTGIAQRTRAARGGADPVAAHDRERGSRVLNFNPVVAVARNQITGPGCAAAKDGVGRVDEDDAILPIPAIQQTRGVR